MYPDCDQWEDLLSWSDFECKEDSLGDGFCDYQNNYPVCNYDDGDVSWSRIVDISPM